MNEIVVSTIIPTYEAGEFLLEAVESALDQTLQGQQIIVVDDGSTDGTSERIKPYLDRIEYIRFEENKGPGAARNAGIRAARGRYIALLDSDDLWMPERLEKMVVFMDTHPEFSFATTDAYFMFDLKPSTRSLFDVPLVHFSLEDQDVRIMRSNFVYNKLILRKQLFEKYGLYDETFVFEDWPKNMEFIMSGERCGFIDEPLAYHRVSSSSLTYRRATLYRDIERLIGTWLKKDLRPEARVAAEEALAESKWALLWTEQVLADKKERARLISDLRSRGPARFRLRAWIASLLPLQTLGRSRDLRFKLLTEGGGHWALDEAVPRLETKNYRAARKNMVAAILFGFPIKTRLAALAWLVLPPARPMLSDLLVKDWTQRGS